MAIKQNPKLLKIVEILNTTGYHDGESMGRELGLTRSAIWKQIKKLIGYGVKIDSVKGKGYKLCEPLTLLDRHRIEPALALPVELYLFESIDSTNHFLKNKATADRQQICLSEHQTEGRGRLSREWYSPFAKNIYCSYRYRFHKDVTALAGLSLVCGLAILKTVSPYLQNDYGVKWPNDIVSHNKKIAGILIEVEAEAHDISDVIIGIGINVNMDSTSREIAKPWTSLSQLSQQYLDRNDIVIPLINTLSNYLQQFDNFGLPHFMTEWQQYDYLYGRCITLEHHLQKMVGHAKGINHQGHLLVADADGKLSAFSSGDVSISAF